MLSDFASKGYEAPSLSKTSLTTFLVDRAFIQRQLKSLPACDFFL